MTDWIIHQQKTGFQLWHGGKRVGGWDCTGKEHLFVLDRYARRIRGGPELLEERGFELVDQPAGHRWWKVPERDFRRFALMVKELAEMAEARP